MPQFLDEPEARIAAIVFEGWNASGALASTADESRPIPSGRFRKNVHGAPLDDPRYPIEAFDRAAEIRWESRGQLPNPRNNRDARGLVEVRFTLRVGYVTGKDNAKHVHLAAGTNETRADAVVNARKRALSDAQRIEWALTLQLLYQGGTDPKIAALKADGASVLVTLSPATLLCETPFVAWLDFSSSTLFDP